MEFSERFQGLNMSFLFSFLFFFFFNGGVGLGRDGDAGGGVYFNLERKVLWNFMQKRIFAEGNVRSTVNTAITTTWNCLEKFPWRILSKLAHSRNILVLLKWHFQMEKSYIKIL